MNNIINKEIHFREKEPYYIYIHTTPEYMRYIGMSKQPIQRWNNGEGYKENKEFYHDIKRFGWDNIKHEIVAETNYKWIAQKIERTLITHFKKEKKCFNETNIESILLNKKSVRIVPLKKVAQYDKENKLIKVYNSASEAGTITHISPSNIQSCCRGKIKSSGGYIWKYL